MSNDLSQKLLEEYEHSQRLTLMQETHAGLSTASKILRTVKEFAQGLFPLQFFTEVADTAFSLVHLAYNRPWPYKVAATIGALGLIGGSIAIFAVASPVVAVGYVLGMMAFNFVTGLAGLWKSFSHYGKLDPSHGPATRNFLNLSTRSKLSNTIVAAIGIACIAVISFVPPLAIAALATLTIATVFGFASKIWHNMKLNKAKVALQAEIKDSKRQPLLKEASAPPQMSLDAKDDDSMHVRPGHEHSEGNILGALSAAAKAEQLSVSEQVQDLDDDNADVSAPAIAGPVADKLESRADLAPTEPPSEEDDDDDERIRLTDSQGEDSGDDGDGATGSETEDDNERIRLTDSQGEDSGDDGDGATGIETDDTGDDSADSRSSGDDSSSTDGAPDDEPTFHP